MKLFTEWAFDHLKNTSLVVKLTLVATLATVLAVSLAGWMSFNSAKDLLLANAVDSMQDLMDRQIERGNSAIDQVQSDVLIISRSEEVREIIRARNTPYSDEQSKLLEDEWRNRLASTFSIMIESKGYKQIRFIGLDDHGREIVRVDRAADHGVPVVVSKDQLQCKGDSTYVTATARLNPAETYISNITLNREHGVIEQPHQPTQRFATPVFYTDKGKLAVSGDKSETLGVLIELGGQIRYYNEILSMSALSAVQSRDQKWEERYYKYLPMLDEAIEHALYLASTRGLPAIEQIAEANQSLVDMERTAFEHTHAGEYEEAAGVLNSKHYLAQKRAYDEGLDRFCGAIKNNSSEVFGVIVINTDAQDFMHNQLLKSNTYGMILTNDAGGIIHHYEKDKEWGFEFGSPVGLDAYYPESWRSVLDDAHPNIWLDDLDQVHVTGRISLDKHDDGRFIGVVMIAHQSEVLAEVSGLRSRTILVSSIAILLTCLLCAFGVRHLTKPVSDLTKQARLITSGEQDVQIASVGYGEFGLLANAFSDLIRKLQSRTLEATRRSEEVQQLADSLDRKVSERTAALAESEARTNAILESAADAIINVDSDGKIKHYNPGAERIFGYRADEIIGEHVTKIIPEESRQRHGPGPSSYLGGGATKILNRTVEVQGLRLDGTIFPLELTISQVQSSEGDLYTAIGRDITERKRVEEELRMAKDGAEKATKAKSDFLANMSHEIRTPMTAILGYTDVLKEMSELAGNQEEQISTVNTIRKNGEQLLQIINDILDISKIESGKLEVEHICCSPVQIVKDVKDLLQVRADEKGILFSTEFVGDIPETITSDPTRLKQILVNLIGNAIKFTDDGAVRVTTRFVESPDGPVIQFDVLDSGIGMSEAQMSNLFQAFSQADNSTTRRYGGTGLGLMISKRMSELLDGTITVESKPGKGSLFRLRVATGPLDGVEMLSQPTLTQHDEYTPPHTEDQLQIRLDCKILVAEDGPDNQRLISYMLKKFGARVVLADNGKLAIEAAEEAQAHQKPFDIILMDMQMPVMGGYEATEILRRRGFANPIIALTAHAMPSDRQRCLDAGCDGYATKPINQRELAQMLQLHLEQSRNKAA